MTIHKTCKSEIPSLSQRPGHSSHTSHIHLLLAAEQDLGMQLPFPGERWHQQQQRLTAFMKRKKKIGDILKYLTGWSELKVSNLFVCFFFSSGTNSLPSLPYIYLPFQGESSNSNKWTCCALRGHSSHLTSDPYNRQNIFEFKPPEITFLSKLFCLSAVHKHESHGGGLISPADHEGWWAGGAFPCQFSVFSDVNPILFPHLRLLLKARKNPFHNPLSLLWYQDTSENRQIGKNAVILAILFIPEMQIKNTYLLYEVLACLNNYYPLNIFQWCRNHYSNR